MAKDVRILAHTAEWNLSAFCNQWIGFISKRIAGARPPLPLSDPLWEYRRILSDLRFPHYEGNSELLLLLSRHRKKQCAVERDRIFSLLSISREGTRMIVDYSLSEIHLLRAVLRVSLLSPCFCTVDAALQGVQTKAMTNLDLSVHFFLRFATTAVAFQPRSTRYCHYCPERLGYFWRECNNGLLFCLSKVCPSISGHLFWEHEEQSRPAKGFYCLGYRSMNSILLGSKGRLVDVSRTRYPTVYILYFTLEAMLTIIRENTKSTSSLFPCCNTKAGRSTTYVAGCPLGGVDILKYPGR